MSQEEYPHGVVREDDEVTILTKDPQSYFPGEQALVDYLWSLPLWRRRLGFRFYVCLRNAGVACGNACGYVALMLISGYPWNKTAKSTSITAAGVSLMSEKQKEERLFDDRIMTLGEYLETLPAWRRTLSLLLSLIKTQWGYLLFLWVSGYPSNKYRTSRRSHKYSDEI